MSEENQFVIKGEYGSTFPVGFLPGSCISVETLDGIEQKPQVCKQCGCEKSLAYGWEYSTWVCSNLCEEKRE